MTTTKKNKKYVYLILRFGVNDVRDTRWGEFTDYHRLNGFLERLAESKDYPIAFKEFRVFELNFSADFTLNESQAHWIVYFKVPISKFTNKIVENTLHFFGLRQCHFSVLSTKLEMVESLEKLPMQLVMRATSATQSFYINGFDDQI